MSIGYSKSSRILGGQSNPGGGQASAISNAALLQCRINMIHFIFNNLVRQFAILFVCLVCKALIINFYINKELNIKPVLLFAVYWFVKFGIVVKFT